MLQTSNMGHIHILLLSIFSVDSVQLQKNSEVHTKDAKEQYHWIQNSPDFKELKN